jgi:KUP system potassium uptake protein
VSAPAATPNRATITHRSKKLSPDKALAIAALGVVYGDIGTSPLYAIRESLADEHGVALSSASILGVLSLVFWSLILVVSIKYLGLVLRADNRGEGGMLALMALVRTQLEKQPRLQIAVIAAGVFGAALLYGDGIITPAISVLSAMEGLHLATPLFDPFVLPFTIFVLIGLFALQKRGTAGISVLFAPVMFAWFGVLALLGIVQIVQTPHILAAISPLRAIHFFADNGLPAFLVLGSVFLVITGAEALYADLGHFGRRAIRTAWFALVLPALLLNYFGQGALLLRNPAAIENPFFSLAPDWALYPLILLATMATVIASQAVISGAFSLTWQATTLGFLPRIRIEHTSHSEIGQVYAPTVNWLMMLACIALVLGFRSTTALAAAYGVAVTTTMVATSLLIGVLARTAWKWSWPATIALEIGLLTIDLAFWGANLVKVPHGGWFPLMVAVLLFVPMIVWKRGRDVLAGRLARRSLPTTEIIEILRRSNPTRVHGIAAFMSRDPERTPPTLLHNLKHNKVLHERVLLLTIVMRDVPRVESSERLSVKTMGHGFVRVVLHYGFTEEIDVPGALRNCVVDGQLLDVSQVTYFLGRETLLPRIRSLRDVWKWLFAGMARNAESAMEFFRLPPGRVVELGAQLEI